MWWVAHAAAEETLQGSPLVPAWLKLFHTQLSRRDDWLRWRGDLAESAELRRAYSGLYGRFFARALLTYHLGLTRFHSLGRNGLKVPNGAEVKRTNIGDLPDWLAWDDQHSRLVLGEAKGSLSARDFLSPGTPKCVKNGRSQFDRVATFDQGRRIRPARWVAATRWATEERSGKPVTVMWDPPDEDMRFGEEEAIRHRAAMARAWLDSIAPGMGWTGADDLLSEERGREALVIRAEPGSISGSEDWPLFEDEGSRDMLKPDAAETLQEIENAGTQDFGDLIGELGDSELYADPTLLMPHDPEPSALQRAYIAALVTRFGIRPVRTANDIEAILRSQEAAQGLEEPAMLVGVPLGIDPASRITDDTWLSGAGIAQPDSLAVFDLRHVTFEPYDHS